MSSRFPLALALLERVIARRPRQRGRDRDRLERDTYFAFSSIAAELDLAPLQ
jgi:hypothetical protein